MDAVTAVGLLLMALGVGIYGSIIGAGGGFLILAGLVLLFGMDGVNAVGTAVVTTLFVQLTGAYTYLRQGLVDSSSAKWFVLGSMPVAFASAAWLASRIPQRTFELLVGLLLMALAIFVVMVRPSPTPVGVVLAPRRGRLVAAGSALGVLSGGVGAGAGLVTVPLLRTVQGLSAHRAAATTTLTGAAAGFAATIGHVFAGNPRWSHVLWLVIGGVSGARIGSLNAGRLSERTVLGLLASGLVIAGLPLVFRSL